VTEITQLNQIKSLSWYINRLSKMPLPELPYRANQALKKRIDEFHYKHFPPLPSQSSSSLDFNRIFQLAAAIDPSQLKKSHPTEISNLCKVAQNLTKNTFTIFGIEKCYGPKVDWHLDVKTGNHWPVKFWARLPIKDGDSIGEPKFTWEIGRFTYIMPLGLAYLVTGDRIYADKIISLLSSWMDDNPYPYGIHWASGIELGIRLSNLIWALSLLHGYEFSKETKGRINQFVSLHAHHLFRYPSKYSSSNNHALAEGFGLFMAGAFFSHLEGAEEWYSFGQNLLEKEAQRQILPDGGSFEYTTTYLSLIIDFFVVFIIICEKFNWPYAQEVKARVEKACDFINALMDAGGHLPNIGDQDSAILVDFGQDNWTNFLSLLNTGAILFNRQDFKVSQQPDLKTCLLTNKSTFDWENRNKPIYGNYHFKDSGLIVIRNLFKEKELLFIGNASPQGMSPLYAHGHLDALSFTLSMGGKEIFIDPGTYLYHRAGKWRRYFRSTAAHNTLRLNGLDFSPQVADFMFGRPYNITLNKLETGAEKCSWIASHDAYKHNLKAKHTRQVDYFTKDGYFTITDLLILKNPTLTELFFHFHPACQINHDGDKLIITRDGSHLSFQPDSKLTLEIYRGCEEPILGWFSSQFNHKEITTSLRLWGDFCGEQKITNTIKILV